MAGRKSTQELENESVDPLILQEKEDPASTNKAFEGFTKFRTTNEYTFTFDVLLRGETIYGAWAANGRKIEFLVPNDLVDAMKAHYHFVSGNVVEVTEDQAA